MFLLLPCAALAQQEAPAVAPPPEGLIHTVVEGDTLWDLSAKHLGSPWKWTEIWERNRFVTNPHYIYPGIRIVIFPPPPTEVSLGETPPPPAPAPAAAADNAATVPPPAPAPQRAKDAVKPVAKENYLVLEPEDAVRGGEFLAEEPKGIGGIWGGREMKVSFSENDVVYLKLDKEVPPGQLLGVYRVRRPVQVYGIRGIRLNSGYVKYLVGILQVGRVDREGQLNARVRKSFEDLTRDDLISEEIPGYSPVKIVPGGEGLEAMVLAGRDQNLEIATGNFIYLDRGSSAGVAVGNVFRVVAVTGVAKGIPSIPGKRVQSEVALAVVVRVSGDFSTAYVYKSWESFEAGVPALRGLPAR